MGGGVGGRKGEVDKNGEVTGGSGWVKNGRWKGEGTGEVDKKREGMERKRRRI